MTRPKVRSTALLGLLNGHLGIAKGHALYLVAVLHIDHRLLLAVRCLALGNTARFIQRYFFAFVRCHYLGTPKATGLSGPSTSSAPLRYLISTGIVGLPLSTPSMIL